MLHIKIPTRREVIEKAKAEGKKIAAVYPIHYPRELFRAFNIQPIEVWGPPKTDTKKANAHLQSYICSVVQSGLAFYLEGGLNAADIIVVPHSCDSLQGLGSIYKDFIKPKQELITIYLPREKNRENVEFLSKELKRIYKQLAEFTHFEPDREKLLEEIKKEEEIDVLVAKFYKSRENLPLSSREFYTILRAREYLPVELFKNILNYALLHSSSGKLKKTGIVISGLLPEPMEILDIIDEMDGFVALDDMACCMRRVYGEGSADDPFERMAERIVNSTPDPTKGSSVDERADFLKSLIDISGAKGVVFYNVKFCEPEYFYHPLLKDKLNESGIKSIVIEADINEPISQQTITRIKAFIEMLKEESRWA